MRSVLDDNYFSDITEEMNTTWKGKYRKSVKQSFDEYLVQYMGQPMSTLLR